MTTETWGLGIVLGLFKLLATVFGVVGLLLSFINMGFAGYLTADEYVDDLYENHISPYKKLTPLGKKCRFAFYSSIIISFGSFAMVILIAPDQGDAPWWPFWG